MCKLLPGILITTVDTAAGAGLPHLNFAQLRQAGLEVPPDPAGDILAGGILREYRSGSGGPGLVGLRVDIGA